MFEFNFIKSTTFNLIRSGFDEGELFNIHCSLNLRENASEIRVKRLLNGQYVPQQLCWNRSGKNASDHFPRTLSRRLG